MRTRLVTVKAVCIFKMPYGNELTKTFSASDIDFTGAMSIIREWVECLEDEQDCDLEKIETTTEAS